MTFPPKPDLLSAPKARPVPPQSKAFRRAVAAYERNDLEKAESLCRTVVRDEPAFFDAVHLLAVIQSRRGARNAALATYDKAIQLRPGNADLCCNRGSLLTELKRYDEALASFDKALALRANYFEALNYRGCALVDKERYEEALASFDKALALRPANVEALNNRGRAQAKLKQFETALASFDAAIAIQSDHVEAINNRGFSLFSLERYEEALVAFESALALTPDHFDALLNRANALRELERYEAAFACYDELLKRRADAPEVLINLSTALHSTGRSSESLDILDRLLTVAPNSFEMWNMRGLVLQDMRRFTEALTCYDRALAIKPDFTTASFNRAYLQLLLGDFDKGWPGYESRRTLGGKVWRTFEAPEWKGEPLAGKRLLLYAEQGLGDAIQFARFGRTAQAMGAEVIVEIHSPLVKLVSTAPGFSQVSPIGSPTLPHDFNLPLMSMPWVLRRREPEIEEIPYLSADPARIEAWKHRLPGHGFRVGIVWETSVATRKHKRSIPLRDFAPLCRVPDVTFISLQKMDAGSEQWIELPPGMKVESLGPEFDSGPDAFIDSAAVMTLLDLVITCDTSTAHLAGALGRPVWVILKSIPDWRWRLDRSDTPWYPTARLFRQTQRDRWSDVLESVAVELDKVVKR